MGKQIQIGSKACYGFQIKELFSSQYDLGEPINIDGSIIPFEELDNKRLYAYRYFEPILDFKTTALYESERDLREIYVEDCNMAGIVKTRIFDNAFFGLLGQIEKINQKMNFYNLLNQIKPPTSYLLEDATMEMEAKKPANLQEFLKYGSISSKIELTKFIDFILY
jgi:hypothetical protein